MSLTFFMLLTLSMNLPAKRLFGLPFCLHLSLIQHIFRILVLGFFLFKACSCFTKLCFTFISQLLFPVLYIAVSVLSSIPCLHIFVSCKQYTCNPIFVISHMLAKSMQLRLIIQVFTFPPYRW